jgi:hypothetical protein
VLSILEWRRRKLAGEAMNGTTPLEIADALESRMGGALAALGELRAGTLSKELRLTLGDLEAMARLGLYYAAKIRGAAALAMYDRSSAAADREQAIRFLEQGLVQWRSYAQAYTAQYTQPHLYNRVGYVDIPALTNKAAEDVEIARRWAAGTIKEDRARPNSADKPFRK